MKIENLPFFSSNFIGDIFFEKGTDLGKIFKILGKLTLDYLVILPQRVKNVSCYHQILSLRLRMRMIKIKLMKTLNRRVIKVK